jgi:hypothetical protein
MLKIDMAKIVKMFTMTNLFSLKQQEGRCPIASAFIFGKNVKSKNRSKYYCIHMNV